MMVGPVGSRLREHEEVVVDDTTTDRGSVAQARTPHGTAPALGAPAVASRSSGTAAGDPVTAASSAGRSSAGVRD